MCWNLAISTEEEREATYAAYREAHGLGDAEFAKCREDIFEPMISRHREMFTHIGHDDLEVAMNLRGRARQKPYRGTGRNEPFPCGSKFTQCYSAAGVCGTGRNELCPCGSGTKYKRCCGR